MAKFRATGSGAAMVPLNKKRFAKNRASFNY